jgi:hypothetical protein
MTRQHVENAIATEAEEAVRRSCYCCHSELLVSSSGYHATVTLGSRLGLEEVSASWVSDIHELLSTYSDKVSANHTSLLSFIKRANWSILKENCGITAHDKENSCHT